MPRAEGESLYESNQLIPVAGGIVDILQVRVTEADHANLQYAGDVTFQDHLEHGIVGTHLWKAEPGPDEHQIFGRTYRMLINPRDPFWGPRRFTLLTPLDNAIRHHVMHAILEVNPGLPTST